MGCCHAIDAFDNTENPIENRIRNVITDIELSKIDFEEFDKKFTKLVYISIIDVDRSDWYLENDTYSLIVHNICISSNNNLDETPRHEQKKLIHKNLDHANFLIKPSSDKKNFPMHFLFQIIPLLKDSIDVKIEFCLFWK